MAQEHRRGIQDTPNPTLDFDFWADFWCKNDSLSQRAEVDLHQLPVPAAQFLHNLAPEYSSAGPPRSTMLGSGDNHL